MGRVKEETRIIGIDDFPFERDKRGEEVPAIGCIFRGKKSLDGVISTKVTVDGKDATKKLIRMINSSAHLGQLQIIMLDGIALAGFNVIDIEKLSKETGLPTIVIIKHKPDLEGTRKALKNNFEDWEGRVKKIEKAGKVHKLKNYGETTYYQKSSTLTKKEAEEVIKISTRRGAIPEPVRVAHLISHGVGLNGLRNH